MITRAIPDDDEELMQVEAVLHRRYRYRPGCRPADWLAQPWPGAAPEPDAPSDAASRSLPQPDRDGQQGNA